MKTGEILGMVSVITGASLLLIGLGYAKKNNALFITGGAVLVLAPFFINKPTK
jgi:hypothetical protein